MSKSARQAFQFVWVAPSAPASASAAHRAPDISSQVPHNNACSARIELMRMVGHPLWLRLWRAHSRIERHQCEKGEVQNREHPRQPDVQTLVGVQSQIAETNK